MHGNKGSCTYYQFSHIYISVTHIRSYSSLQTIYVSNTSHAYRASRVESHRLPMQGSNPGLARSERHLSFNLPLNGKWFHSFINQCVLFLYFYYYSRVHRLKSYSSNIANYHGSEDIDLQSW